MFLKKTYQKSTGKTQLEIVQGYRENGKPKHKVIKGLGYLEDYLDQYDDPVEHFKQVAKEMSQKDEAEKLEILLSQRLPDQCDNRKNLGYAFIKDVYARLHIREFFQARQKNLNIEFNLNSIFSLLVFNRFLFPSSKKNAFETKDIFFENYKFSLDDVYHSLDHFYEYSEALQKHLHEEVTALVGRDTDLGYYDVTNYYFEIPYEDENEYDDDGRITKVGFKRRGPSKEHRKDPIVQMGLLMDKSGIPMAFNTFSGGESEKTTMLPAIARVKRDYGIDRVVVVADRGLNTSDNTTYLSGVNHDDMHGNDGYIYGQSIMGGTDEFKKWVLDQAGYIDQEIEDEDGETIIFRHKSRIVPKEVTLKDSKGNRRLKTNIYQKQMVYYSEKYAKKQRADRDRAVQKAREADYVVFFGGLNKSDYQDCEGHDRKDYALPYGQNELIEALVKVNPRLVYVNISGNAVEMPWKDKVAAIVQGWFIGSEAGEALADVLVGETNPSGKLPFTWSATLNDVPAHRLNAFPGVWRKGEKIIDEEYKEGLFVGYRGVDKYKTKPAFAFGHGLSYTTFKLGKAVADKKQLTADGQISFTVSVTNTGSRAGAEVVQLYISDLKSSLPRPLKELKGFQKVALQPGETRNVTITIGCEALSFYDDTKKAWTAEPGEFEALIGTASDRIASRVKFTLQ